MGSTSTCGCFFSSKSELPMGFRFRKTSPAKTTDVMLSTMDVFFGSCGPQNQWSIVSISTWQILGMVESDTNRCAPFFSATSLQPSASTSMFYVSLMSLSIFWKVSHVYPFSMSILLGSSWIIRRQQTKVPGSAIREAVQKGKTSKSFVLPIVIFWGN